MIKTVGELKKALRGIRDDTRVIVQSLGDIRIEKGIAVTRKIDRILLCTWRDSVNKDYLTDELKESVEKDCAPPYHWVCLKKPVFVIDL